GDQERVDRDRAYQQLAPRLPGHHRRLGDGGAAALPGRQGPGLRRGEVRRGRPATGPAGTGPARPDPAEAAVIRRDHARRLARHAGRIVNRAAAVAADRAAAAADRAAVAAASRVTPRAAVTALVASTVVTTTALTLITALPLPGKAHRLTWDAGRTNVAAGTTAARPAPPHQPPLPVAARPAASPEPGTLRQPSGEFVGWAILDRTDGSIIGSNNMTEVSTTASLIKAWIVADFLRREAEAGRTPSDLRMAQLELII